MPVIVEMSIQGKLTKPIMPNVASGGDTQNLNRTTSGITETASDNVAKLNRSKGIPSTPSQIKGSVDGAAMAMQLGSKATVPIGEQFKGVNFNDIA